MRTRLNHRQRWTISKNLLQNHNLPLTNDYTCSLILSPLAPHSAGHAMSSESINLAPAEWEVMKVLWDKRQAAARDVHAALPEQGWSDRTVKTLLSRLVAKGAVEYEQIGNSYLYRPGIKRQTATRQELRSVLGRVVSQTLTPLLSAFVDEADLTDDDIAELERLLEEKKKTAAKRSKKKGRS